MQHYKVIDIFGNEEIRVITKKRQTNKSLFDDYDGFVNKFKAKKTTDDCYTPDPIYQIVIDYVRKHINLDGVEVIRPFYPGVDYTDIVYPDNSIVIDNPPFSIISKIVKYYIRTGVRFFLFAPHLTLFSSDLDCTVVVAGAKIVYENGARVRTSFLSNIFGDLKILTAPEIFRAVKKYNNQKSQKLPKYRYPDNIVTVSMIQKITENGIVLEIDKSHCAHTRQLDDQKKHGKTVFGSGFLLSEKAAAEKAAAERVAAEKAAAEKAAAEKAAAVIFALSDREVKIINGLGAKGGL